MRNELENIELIDKYLNGELTANERSIVEERIGSDPSFKNLLDIQKDLQTAIHRASLRKEIKKVVKSGGGSSGFGKWMAGGLIVLVLAFTAFYFSNTKKENKNAASINQSTVVNPSNTDDQPTEAGSTEHTTNTNANTSAINNNTPQATKNNCYDFNGLSTWVKPNVQEYTIKADKGDLIVAKNGTLVSVPSNAFIDDAGKIISGTVKLKIVEAINLEDIVLYNLGTTADGKLLQTGGMLHLQYESNGKKVNVNPQRPLYIQVPTTKIEPNMMAFEGETKAGKVNWKNPQPLKKYLINMDFGLLDFLPKGFSDSVETFIPYREYLTFSKKLADSLYYSLHFGVTDADVVSTVVREVDGAYTMKYAKSQPPRVVSAETTTSNTSYICGINPISIKTIKTEKFDHTFLATREFEERVAALHSLEKGDELLKVYVDNLGKDLCFSDSIVTTKLNGSDKLKFQAFAKQKLGNVKDAEIYQKALSQYFNDQKKKYLQDQQQLKTVFKTVNAEQLKKLYDDYKKRVLQQGSVYTNNYNNTVKQNPVAVTPQNLYYSFPWAGSGWMNIDEYLHILSKGSQKVKMNVSGNTGTTEVYQYLNIISTLTPLYLQDSTAYALVPLAGTSYASGMQNTYCMAISKEGDTYKWFDQMYNPYKNPELTVKLENTEIGAIRAKLRSYGVTKDLARRMDQLEESKKKQAIIAAQQKRAVEDAGMIRVLRKVAFTCETGTEQSYH